MVRRMTVQEAHNSPNFQWEKEGGAPRTPEGEKVREKHKKIREKASARTTAEGP